MTMQPNSLIAQKGPPPYSSPLSPSEQKGSPHHPLNDFIPSWPPLLLKDQEVLSGKEKSEFVNKGVARLLRLLEDLLPRD